LPVREPDGLVQVRQTVTVFGITKVATSFPKRPSTTSERTIRFFPTS
jgi:hypothetical protein